MQKSRRILATILFFIGVGCMFAAAVVFFKHSLEDEFAEMAVENVRPDSETVATIEGLPVETQLPGTAPEEAVTPQPIPVPEATATPTPEPTSTPEPTPTPIINPYAESYLANKDMAGWLVIPGTNIDYPVMWTPEDENYYLYKDFEGRKNSNGSLILDTDSCLDPLTTNLIIHGHNMKSGAMFGNLTDYEDPDYYKEHKNEWQ